MTITEAWACRSTTTTQIQTYKPCGWWKSNNAWGCCWHRPTSFCGFYALSTCSVYEYIVVYELLQWPLLVTQTAHIEAADYFLLVALLLAVFLPLFLLLLLWSLLISASDHIDWNWWWWWHAGEMRTSRSRKEMKWKRENRKREKKKDFGFHSHWDRTGSYGQARATTKTQLDRYTSLRHTRCALFRSVVDSYRPLDLLF